MGKTSKLKVKDYTYMALFTAIITICSWICVPTVVPFTMQTFAIFVTIGLLGCKRSTITVIVYILLGMIGVPVFSGFQGGVGVLLGKTGGYIIGFLITAIVGGLIIDKFGKKTRTLIIAMSVGMVLCYFFGSLWYMWVYMSGVSESIGIVTVLSMCVIPFIVPDIIKMAVAVLIIKSVSKYASI